MPSRNALIGLVSSVLVLVVALGLLVLLDETTDTDSRTCVEPVAGRTTTHADLAVVALVGDRWDGLG